MPHKNYFMFLDDTKTCDVPILTRRKFERVRRLLSMNLIKETTEPMNDPNTISQQ